MRILDTLVESRNRFCGELSVPGTIYKISCEDAIAFLCEAAWGFAEVDANGSFVWINRAYCDILNVPPDLILGTTYRAWTHPEDIGIDDELARQVREGLIPGYTLAKRYLQRGSTPQRQLVIWGMLSVQGKRSPTGEFAGYRVQFRPYQDSQRGHLQLDIKGATKWAIANWKTILTVLTVSSSLIFGGSGPLLDAIRRAKDTADSVGSVLDSSSPGPSVPQP